MSLAEHILGEASATPEIGTGDSSHSTAISSPADAHVGPAVIEHDIRTIRESGLFDDTFYRANNPEFPPEVDAVRHFVETGAREGRIPNRIFDPAFYLAKYPDVAASGQNPLVHYILFGEKEGRSPGDLRYEAWCQLYDTIKSGDRSKIQSRLEQLHYHPLISVIWLADDNSGEKLSAVIRMLSDQLYTKWELCFAPSASTGRSVCNVARDSSGKDRRIKVFDQSDIADRCAAFNTVLNMAEGEFVALLENQVQLSETALYMLVEELNEHTSADILYSDEDDADDADRRSHPHFKSDWNLDLFYGHNYLGGLIVCRTSLLRVVGGLRPSFEGAEVYDLLLRIIEKSASDRIRHIPFILHHRRMAEPGSGRRGATGETVEMERKALSDHFTRIGESGVEVVPGPGGELHRIVRPAPSPQPLVSLVMPTGGKVELLDKCLSGISRSHRVPEFRNNHSLQYKYQTGGLPISRRNCG